MELTSALHPKHPSNDRHFKKGPLLNVIMVAKFYQLMHPLWKDILVNTVHKLMQIWKRFHQEPWTTKYIVDLSHEVNFLQPCSN